MSHIQFKTMVDRQKWYALRVKIDNLKALLVRLHAIAPPAIRDIIDTNTGAWMQFGLDSSSEGMAYGGVYIYSHLPQGQKAADILRHPAEQHVAQVTMEDYHRTEEDYLRGKKLIQKIFSRAEENSEIKRLIACSAPYSPQLEQFALVP